MSPKDTRELLELQALRFFAVNDFERSSLSAIAEALGVTKGAIYHYFDGKDDLFRSSVHRLLDILEEWFAKALPGDVPLKILMENFFRIEEAMAEMGEETGLGDVVGEYLNTLYLLLAAQKKFPELLNRLDRIYNNFRSILVGLMNDAIARGEIRPDTDTEAVAFEITAFYEGALLLGAFSSRKDYAVLGSRVCAAIWDRMAKGDTQ